MIANEDNLFLNPSTSKVFGVPTAVVISSELLNTSLIELNLLPNFPRNGILKLFPLNFEQTFNKSPKRLIPPLL